MKRKLTAGLMCLALMAGLAGCTAGDGEKSTKNDGRLSVVATIFPQYDFARQIGGDKVNVTMLLPPGTESHTFDPKPSDIVTVQGSDVFLYTGKDMEPWAQSIVSSLDSQRVLVSDLSSGMALIREDHTDEEPEEHEHGSDPHIWLDPTLAIKMVDRITEAFCQKDSENAAYYQQNAKAYQEKLSALDRSFQSAVQNGKRKQVAFGGKFAYIYFIRRYSLQYVSAFDSCSTQSEPSVKKISTVISYMKEHEIPVIFYEELATPKVADSIAQETGAKALQFSTAHNVTKEEFSRGITYLDIMEANLTNLKAALS